MIKNNDNLDKIEKKSEIIIFGKMDASISVGNFPVDKPLEYFFVKTAT